MCIINLTVFENLPMERTGSFRFPPNRLRIISKSKRVVRKSKWYNDSSGFLARKTGLSIQMESASETSRYKVCPYHDPFPSLPRLFSFPISSHLSSTVLRYQTTDSLVSHDLSSSLKWWRIINSSARTLPIFSRVLLEHACFQTFCTPQVKKA